MLQKLQADNAVLKLKTDEGHSQELAVQREKIGEELNILRQQLGTNQTEINTRQSQFDRVLRPGYKNTKIQLSKIEIQQKKTEKDIADATVEQDQVKHELEDLEKTRVELSQAVLSAREEAKKFTSQIDVIESD
jgi:chromosome segregation ATPase